MDKGRRRVCCLLLVGLASSLLPAGLRADQPAARYVSTVGDDGADGLTPATAWRTLDRADDLAPAGAEIHVAPGDYREDSAGLGYLRIDSPAAGRQFLAQGEVRLQAAQTGVLVLQLGTGVDFDCQGFSFDGEGACARLVQGAGLSARFRSCRFAGATSRALELNGATDVLVQDCDFGDAASPLAAVGIWLSDCPGARVLDSRFFVHLARALSVDRSPGADVAGNQFGSEAQPLDLGTQWCLYIVNSSDVRIEANLWQLVSGHALGVPAGAMATSGVSVLANTIHCSVNTIQYGILIGSETPPAHAFTGVHVADNTLIAPIPLADATKHLLFVGYTQAPEVSGNTVVGGGYGLVIKGNDAASVHHNRVEASRRWGILDKGGTNCSFHDNLVTTGNGYGARLGDDDTAGQAITGSTWYGNEFRGGAPPFEIVAPVTPAANALSGHDNRIYLARHDDPVLRLWSGMYDLWAAQATWGWELNSALIAEAEAPLPRGEDLLAGSHGAQLRVDCSELCTGDLAYGAGDWADTLRLASPAMQLDFALSGLDPGTDYQYCYTLTDSDSCVFQSSPGYFTTESGSAAPALGTERLALGAVHPNPGRPASAFTLQLGREGPLDLALFTITGRRLRTLACGPCSAGARSFTLTGEDEAGRPLPAGLYLVRASDGQRTVTARWVLLR